MPAIYISEYEAVVAAKKVMSERGVITNQVNHVYCDVSYQGDTLLYEVIINNGYAVLLSGTKNYTPVLAVYVNMID